MAKLDSPASLEKLRQQILAAGKGKKIVSVTDGTDGRTRGSQSIVQAFVKEIDKHGLRDTVIVKGTGCHGFCEQEPTALILPEGICYVGIQPKDVPEIIAETLVQGKIVERLLYKDPISGQRITKESEIPFYKSQSRIILGNNRFVDPHSIDDYIALGGYSALAKALFKMKPEQILDDIKTSNLRGRGGGGFPTGIKWETTRNAAGETKYVIVNADEGDPGAYMNRSVLEGNPHSVLEGLIIGAFTIGSNQGYIYVRQEYPLAVHNITRAIEQAREYGLLGNDILGSGFNFDVTVHRGAGAFVSGESSALMTAIEGRVGEPKPKYIHTAVTGLREKPSILNNVETWANIPLIVNNGPDWFKKTGSKNSSGTKIFSLVGKVNNTGLVEVPLGTKLREIIFNIGGGSPKGKKFKAVQTGGPSGGCIPESLLDMPVDFDELVKVGSMMGSGGMIIMDEDVCMVDIARYFVNFLREESCGKCIPCREGLRQMSVILNDICSGRGSKGDIDTLNEIAELMKNASLCALGTSAANPVLSTIKYFRDEYEDHINGKRCSAGFCKDLITYYIQPEKCRACLICTRECSVGAIGGEKNTPQVIDQAKCTKCGTCFEVCPAKFRAVVKTSGTVPAGASR